MYRMVSSVQKMYDSCAKIYGNTPTNTLSTNNSSHNALTNGAHLNHKRFFELCLSAQLRRACVAGLTVDEETLVLVQEDDVTVRLLTTAD